MHDDAFALLAQRHARLIAYRARKPLPGLTEDERGALCTEALWHAYRTFDPEMGLSLEQYWWVIWSRERARAMETAFRLKRRMVTAHDPETLQSLAAHYVPEIVPPCPVGGAEPVWWLLSLGYPARMVRHILGMTRYRFDRTMETLRTPEVYDLLTTPIAG